MQIYSGTFQAAVGQGAQTAAVVTELRNIIASTSGGSISAWSVVAGAPVGSFAISTRVDGTSALMGLQQGMAASSEYQQLVTKFAGLFAAPAETALVDVIGMTGEPSEPKQLVAVTTASIANSASGGIGAAVAWSTQVLERAGAVTGASGMLGITAAGPMFQVYWIFGADDGDSMDELNAKVADDAEYGALLDSAGGLFVEGSAQRIIMAQLP